MGEVEAERAHVSRDSVSFYIGLVLQVALELFRLRLVLPAAEQGFGLSGVRQGVPPLGPEGHVAV